jgi:hypothetical protein
VGTRWQPIIADGIQRGYRVAGEVPRRAQPEPALSPVHDVADVRQLGSVDISPQPDERTDEVDEAEIGAIQLVET